MTILLIFLQLVFNLALAVVVFSMLKKQNIEKKDQRLSEGLRMLESKLYFLKKLSEQIDNQIFSTSHVLDHSSQDAKDLQRLKIETENFKEVCKEFEENKSSTLQLKTENFKTKLSEKANQFAHDLKQAHLETAPLEFKKKEEAPKLKLIHTELPPEDTI